MDLLQLRYFQAVARKEHISRAAEELRVAQPSLSRTIARLEGELGVPLFDRRGRQIRLNEYGTAFLRRVDRALGELDDARRELADVTGPDQGSLVIASETLLTVTAVLAGFRARYPGIGIRLRQANAEEMGRQLREREVDLCVASQPITGPGLGMVRLLDEEVLLAVHPDHALAGRERVAVAELAAEPFVTTRRGHWPRELLERLFAAEGLRPVIACEGDEPAATADLIAAGLGVGLVPAMSERVGLVPMLSGQPATRTPVVWVRVDDPSCRRQLTLVWREDAYLSAAAGLFRAHALSVMS